jgi:hypothetical protein
MAAMTPQEAQAKGLIVVGYIERLLQENPRLRAEARAALERDGNGHTPETAHTLRQLGRIVDLIGLHGYVDGRW